MGSRRIRTSMRVSMMFMLSQKVRYVTLKTTAELPGK